MIKKAAPIRSPSTMPATMPANAPRGSLWDDPGDGSSFESIGTNFCSAFSLKMAWEREVRAFEIDY